MSLTAHSPLIPSPIFMADMAAVAAFVCGSFPSPRKYAVNGGGSPPASRCHCRMAAAITVFPAAKSANHPSSRRQTT